MNKKTYKGFSYFRSLIFLFLLISVIAFQGQQSGSVFDDENPNIEQPTLESYMNFRNNNQPHIPSIITIDGYDNFDIGTDNWEQNMTINPLNPLEIFFGVNASPQNARYSTNGGLNWTQVHMQIMYMQELHRVTLAEALMQELHGLLLLLQVILNPDVILQ